MYDDGLDDYLLENCVLDEEDLFFINRRKQMKAKKSSSTKDEALDCIAAYEQKKANGYVDMTLTESFQNLYDDIESEEKKEIEKISQLDWSQINQDKERFERRLNLHNDHSASHQLNMISQAMEHKNIELEKQKKLTAEINRINAENKEKYDKIDAAIKLIESQIEDQTKVVDNLENEFSNNISQPDSAGSNQQRIRSLLTNINNRILDYKKIYFNYKEIFKLRDEKQNLIDKSQDELNHLQMHFEIINHKISKIMQRALYMYCDTTEEIYNDIKKNRQFLNFYSKRKKFYASTNQNKIYVVTNMNVGLINSLLIKFPNLFRSWDDGLSKRDSNQILEALRRNINIHTDRFRSIEEKDYNNRSEFRICLVPHISLIPLINNTPNYFRQNVIYLEDGHSDDNWNKIDRYTIRYNESIKISIRKPFFEIDMMNHIRNRVTISY